MHTEVTFIELAMMEEFLMSQLRSDKTNRNKEESKRLQQQLTKVQSMMVARIIKVTNI